METVSSNGIATPPKRPEVHVSIHDRGLGLARAIVARRIIPPKHLQGRLGDTTGEPKGSRREPVGETRHLARGCSVRIVRPKSPLSL